MGRICREFLQAVVRAGRRLPIGLRGTLVVALAAMGVSPSAVAQTPATSTVSEPNLTLVTTAELEIYQKSPGRWVAERKSGVTFHFIEERREAGKVHLFDRSRDMRLQLDIAGRQLLFSQGGKPFARLAEIVNVSAQPQSMATRCAAAFQGRIAWDGKGNKNWQPENLAALCRDVTDVPSVVACFQRHMLAKADWQAATRQCAEGRLQVKVVYAIPKGQTPRPDAEKALEAIMKVVQRHYFEQLGVTFKLREPLVTVVPVAETVAELRGRTSTDPSVMTARTEKLATTEFREDHVEKSNVLVVVYEGLASDVATGGFNRVTIPNYLWQPAYEKHRSNPDDLHKVDVLHGWSHELGHAFGLFHTEDARKCFERHGVDIGVLPSLIMQKKEDLGSLYKYAFIPQEKRMLLDESFLPRCLPLVGDRPHASMHLRHPMPK